MGMAMVMTKTMTIVMMVYSQFTLFRPLDRILRTFLDTRLVFLLLQRDRHQSVVCAWTLLRATGSSHQIIAQCKTPVEMKICTFSSKEKRKSCLTYHSFPLCSVLSLFSLGGRQLRREDRRQLEFNNLLLECIQIRWSTEPAYPANQDTN